MGDFYAEIYQNQAEIYQEMVSREDYQGHIFTAIQNVRDLSGLDVIDSGAGTGRLACLFAPLARSVSAFDTSEAMLSVAARRLKESGLDNWRTAIADHRQLPAGDNSADVILSGWSVVYTVVWYPNSWRDELNQALSEMRRVLRPGGHVILLETMGTGYEAPHPPADLLDYFRFLDQSGFSSSWFRTDYRFASLEEARRLSAFFFGEEIIQKLQAGNEVILPECTGMWWKQF